MQPEVPAARGESARDTAREPFPLPGATEAVARLACVGAAIGLFARSVALGQRYTPFVEKNFIEEPARRSLVASVLVGGCTLLVIALGSLALWRRRAMPGLVLASRLASPLVLLFALPTLLAYHLWRYAPLSYLVLLAAVTLVGERLMRGALDAVPPSVGRYLGERVDAVSVRIQRLAPLVVVVVLGAAYSAWAIHYTILNHRRLGTSGFDLAIYDNLLFNALHGHFFRSPTLFGPSGGNYLANHAEFAMMLFLPFYALHPGPETLLVLQAVLLGMSAVPLYLFARTQIPRGSAVIVAAAYLLFAPLHGPNFYDFHWLPCAIFFHFWLYYAIAKDRPWLIATMLVILFAIREDVAVGTAVLGVFLTVTGARPKLGLVVAGASALWFVTDKFGIMMHAGTWWFSSLYSDLIPDGEWGYGAVVKTLLTNPVYVVSTLLKEDKLTYVLHLFAPLAWLPARRPALLLLLFPGFFFTLLTTAYWPTVSIAFQYTTHWIPYLFAATVVCLMLLSRARGVNARRAALFALAFGVTWHSYVFGAVLQHDTLVGGFKRIQFAMSEADEREYADLEHILELIPSRASVAATDPESPHVSTRLTAYSLDHHHGDADYLLIHKRHIHGDARLRVAEALDRNPYGLVGQVGNFFLFAQNSSSPQTRAALDELQLGTSRLRP